MTKTSTSAEPEKIAAKDTKSPADKPAPAQPSPAAKAPAAAPPAGKPTKQYRVVLGGAEDDPKNAKYPLMYSVRIFVDNPSPLTATLGPPPNEKNPRFVPLRVPPKPTVVQPQKPAAPAPTTPVDAAAAEVEL